MPNTSLHKDGQFTVGENKGLDYVLAFLCSALFLYGLVDAIGHKFTNFSASSVVFLLALIAGILFFRKGNSKRVYIRINSRGIYEDEKLVTGWSNFHNAYIDQKDKVITIQDNFQLVVEFLKEGSKQGVRRKIPLTNTQNKSEEEVLEAVKFYWQVFKSEQGM